MTDISPLGGGETKPDKQTNPAPPVGGWVGRHTVSSIRTTPARDINLDRGAARRHAQSPEPPGPAQPSSKEQHNQPQAPIMLPTQPPPQNPVSPQQPPPWVGGWADRKLPENEKANNCLSTNKGLPRG